MCGICGIIYSDPRRPATPEALAAMLDALTHRGPDEQGTYLNRNVGLGNRRLSIIDIAGGRQPVSNEDGTIHAVCNGEIYNYRELTKKLQSRGHKFRTQTDTEVLTHAYEEYGDQFVEHLNGMFAFALWDARKQRLLLVRDRMGIKPLYYARRNNALIFASEIRALATHPEVTTAIDPVALSEYLSFEYVPTPRSIYQGVSKLPPGHLLEFADGAIQIRPYWDLNLGRSETAPERSLKEYTSELREILSEVVASEMMADVPLGVLLSGGVDSTAVAAMMVAHSSQPVQSFSIAFDDPTFDESRHARQAAAYLGTEHHELTLTEADMLALTENLPNTMDEPLGDSSFIPTLFLSQFARQHVKVALGGDGGDEMFAGYPTLLAFRLAEYYERLTPAFVRRKLVPQMARLLPVSFNNMSLDFKIRKFISADGLPPVVRHHSWLGSFTPEQKNELLTPEFRTSGDDTYAIARQHWEACDARESLNQLLYCDAKLYLEGDILAKVDRASMAASLEVRVPLLNHRLVEFTASVPHALKLKGLTGKYLFKQALQGLVPPAILQRKKKGFNMPVARWLTGPLREIAGDMLAPERLRADGFFNADVVGRLLGEHFAGGQDHRKLLWTLLTFQIWYAHQKKCVATEVK